MFLSGNDGPSLDNMTRLTRGQKRCTVHQKSLMFVSMCSSINFDRSSSESNVFSPTSGLQDLELKSGEWIYSCWTLAKKEGSYFDSGRRGFRAADVPQDGTKLPDLKKLLDSMRRSRVVCISWNSVGGVHCCMTCSCSSAGNSAYL